MGDYRSSRFSFGGQFAPASVFLCLSEPVHDVAYGVEIRLGLAIQKGLRIAPTSRLSYVTKRMIALPSPLGGSNATRLRLVSSLPSLDRNRFSQSVDRCLETGTSGFP